MALWGLIWLEREMLKYEGSNLLYLFGYSRGDTGQGTDRKCAWCQLFSWKE